MQRPAGVTASAVVTFLGSALVLLLGGLMIAMSRRPAPGGGAVAAVVGVVFVALAALGIWTGLSLLRLRPWARTSILVFAGILAGISAISAIAALVMPASPGADAQRAAALAWVGPLVAALYMVPLGIGVWWLVYFNRPRARAAFQGAREPGMPPRRPLSISIFGWLGIFGGAMSLLGAALRWPVLVGHHVATGWSAVLVFLVFAGVNLYLGWGLLRLSERARRLSIVWSALTMAHTLYVTLAPGAWARMAEVQRALPFPVPAETPIEPAQLTVPFTLLGVVVGAVFIWILVRARPAFSSDR